MTTKTYILDNGKSWSDHRLYFIEADPADFEPLWALYAKAWPRVCHGCGCGDTLGTRCATGRAHYLPNAYTLVAVASSFEWRVGGSASIFDWLEAIGMGLDDSVADVEAAVAFVAMARRWRPDFDEYRAFPFELRKHG
jgi:hypothetical protein